jgi:hypothetical protein
MSRADTGEPTAPGRQAVPEADAPGRARKLRLMSVRTSRGSSSNLHGIIDVPTEQNMRGLASIPSSSWRKSLYGPRHLGRRSEYARTGHGGNVELKHRKDASCQVAVLQVVEHATTSMNGPLAANSRAWRPVSLVPGCVISCHGRPSCCGVHGRMADGVRAARAVGVHRRFSTDGHGPA